MALLRQTARPASAATWTEHMYSGELKVINGEVEVEDQNTIDLLIGRGYTIVDPETKDVPVRILGTIRYGEEVNPQGTQTVTAEDADAVSEGDVVQESAQETPEAKSVEAQRPAQPTPQTPKKRRGRPRKNAQGAK